MSTSSGGADPAVLIKAYTAEIVRGHYLLGTRVVHLGETVRVQRVDGPRAYVKTGDGDPLTVYLADLRAIPEKPLPAPVAASSPAPTPPPALAVVPAEPPISVLRLLGGQPTTEAAGEKPKHTGDARREAAVQCSCLTKKGTRCTRMTRSPNGLCWQHGGD